jgi:hypothetical protein
VSGESGSAQTVAPGVSAPGTPAQPGDVSTLSDVPPVESPQQQALPITLPQLPSQENPRLEIPTQLPADLPVEVPALPVVEDVTDALPGVLLP